MFKNTIQTKVIVKIALLFTYTLLFTNSLQAQQVAKGPNFSVVVRNDGTLWAWGDNTYGQLGDGTNTFRYTPVQIGTASNWKAVWVGDFHTAAIKTDGTLWVWGRNNYGQLGVGTNDDYNIPIQINLAKNWSTVACGMFTTYAIKTDGNLWVWGRNNYGQLGDGTKTDKNTPIQISSTIGWKKIAPNESTSSNSFTTAIKTDGTFWFWGFNFSSTFTTVSNNISRNTSYLTPTQYNSSIWISIGGAFGIQNNGTLWNFNYSGANQIGTGTSWQSVDAKGKTFQMTDGTIWDVNLTQIDNGINWKYFMGNGTSVIGMKTDGSIYSWGNNKNIDLGLGKTFESKMLIPTQIGKDNDWKIVAKFYNNPLVQKNDGSLWAWGYGALGQSGCGVNYDLFTPSLVNLSKNWDLQRNYGGSEGYVSSRFVFKTDGSLWAWGSNSSGQLGDGTQLNKNIPTQIATSVNWKAVSSNSSTTAAIKTDGSLWTWGNNVLGQLGDGTTILKSVPTQIGTTKDWSSIRVAFEYVHAIKFDGSLWSWGYNSSGQLGDGTTVNKTIPTQIGMDRDWKNIETTNYSNSTFALKTDSSLWGWGYNYDGSLGDGTTVSKTNPTQIGIDKDWLKVSYYDMTTFALKSNGSLWAWGFNSYGEMGDGTTVSKTNPTQISTDKDWKNILRDRRDYSTIGIKTDGSLWAWGHNRYGIMGDGTTIDKIVPTQIGTDKDWLSFEVGSSSVLALKTDGSLWSWGDNSYGQLGIGGQRDFDVPQLVNFSNNALPVSALNLEGISSANKIQLSFTAINETDMDHYEIEKSADGRVFTTIGELMPQNKIQNQTQYQFTDANPFEGQNFYRIKGISLNGKQQYSNVIALKTNAKPNAIVSPNPLVGNLLRLKTNNLTKGKYQATIIDALGRVILKKQIIINNATTEILIHFDAKPRVGNYYLQIAGENTKITSAFEINQ
jgi:alpha-tubulin suppressor-like RCC1 family protein